MWSSSQNQIRRGKCQDSIQDFERRLKCSKQQENARVFDRDGFFSQSDFRLLNYSFKTRYGKSSNNARGILFETHETSFSGSI